MPGTFRCSTCSQMCQSRIGLFSHYMIHHSWWGDSSHRRLSPYMQSSSKTVITNKPTPNFLQAGCPSCHPTNSVRALKVKESAVLMHYWFTKMRKLQGQRWFHVSRNCGYQTALSKIRVSKTSSPTFDVARTPADAIRRQDQQRNTELMCAILNINVQLWT